VSKVAWSLVTGLVSTVLLTLHHGLVLINEITVSECVHEVKGKLHLEHKFLALDPDAQILILEWNGWGNSATLSLASLSELPVQGLGIARADLLHPFSVQ